MTSGLVVTSERRVKAAQRASLMRLGRTMALIQDGGSPDEVKDMAMEEYLILHKNCPCCEGSMKEAERIADFIYHEMLDYPR